jgi:hypothetical protein
VRSSLEFHDSTVSAIIVDGASVRIAIDGYVHHWEWVDGTWKGTGWMQPVQIVLVNSSHEGQSECPVRLTDGGFRRGKSNTTIWSRFRSNRPDPRRFASNWSQAACWISTPTISSLIRLANGATLRSYLTTLDRLMPANNRLQPTAADVIINRRG